MRTAILLLMLGACVDADEAPPAPTPVQCTVASTERIPLIPGRCETKIVIDVACDVESPVFTQLLIGWQTWFPVYVADLSRTPYRCGESELFDSVGPICDGPVSGFAVFYDPTTDTYSGACEQQL